MQNSESIQSKNPRRVAAGQRNGLLARGRKSTDGRARSAMNAARHGLASQHFTVLPMEDQSAFLEFSQTLEATLAPQDAYEHTLVYQIITSRWKLLRIDDLERIARTLEYDRAAANPSLLPQSKSLFPSEILYWYAFENASENKHYQALQRYRLQYERLVARAQKLLLDYRKAPKPPIANFSDIDPLPDNPDKSNITTAQDTTPPMETEPPPNNADKTNITTAQNTNPPRGTVPAWTVPERNTNTAPTPTTPTPNNPDKTNITTAQDTTPPRGTVPAWTVPEQTPNTAPNANSPNPNNADKTNITTAQNTTPPRGTVPAWTVPEQSPNNAPNPTTPTTNNADKTNISHPQATTQPPEA